MTSHAMVPWPKSDLNSAQLQRLRLLPPPGGPRCLGRFRRCWPSLLWRLLRWPLGQLRTVLGPVSGSV